MNKIINTLMVITESASSVSIDDNGLLTAEAKELFMHLFSDVEDFRQSGKITYRLSDLLLMTLLVILIDKSDSFLSIAASIRVMEPELSALGLIHDHKCPSHDTLRRIFSALDSSSLQQTTIDRLDEFLKLLEKNISYKGKELISVDGKQINGSGRKKGTKSPHGNIAMLNVYNFSRGVCLESTAIDEKTNEIPEAQKILAVMNLKNIIVTADALHCQRITCDVIRGKKGHYVLTVKENQGLLLEEIKTRMSDSRRAKYIHKYTRGKRIITILHLPAGYAADGFTGMKSFVCMHNTRNKDEEVVRYFISDMNNDELICEAIEDRWEIEDSFHNPKDTWLEEDKIRYYDKKALKNIVVMNNLALLLVRLYSALIQPDMYMAKHEMHLKPMQCIEKVLAIKNSSEITKALEESIRQHTKS